MKIRLPLLLILFSAVSCSERMEVPVACNITEDRVSITLSADAGTGLTKAAGCNYFRDETAINSLQFLVFKDNGSLCAYGSSSGSEVVMEVPKNKTLTCYAVANAAADLSGIDNLSDLLSTRSKYLDNTVTNFEMIGHKQITPAGNEEISINLERFASRIQVDSLFYNIKCSTCEERYLTEVYFQNAASDCAYSLEGNPSSWMLTSIINDRLASVYPSARHGSEEIDGITYKVLIDSVTAYCYPNPVTDPKGKMTRFVMIFLGTYYLPGDDCQYNCRHYLSLSFPNIKNNIFYRIPKITITENPCDTYDNNTSHIMGTTSVEFEIIKTNLKTGELVEKEKRQEEVHLYEIDVS